MSEDLIARLLRWADSDDETLMGKRKPDQTSLKRLAAARIAELEAELAEATNTERADVINWLRDQVTCGCGRTDCIADNHPLGYAECIERGDHVRPNPGTRV